MFLVLHPMESISLNSFALLDHLVMLLISTLAINCYLRNFLNKALSIINFAKHFQNFIDDTMIWFLNSKFDLNLSCAKDFRNLISMVTRCINWRRLLALIIFQRSSLELFPIIKEICYNINVLQQTTCLVVNPITVGNFAFLFNCTPVGRTSDSIMVLT